MNGEFAFSLGYFGKILEKIFKLSTKKSCGKRKKPVCAGIKKRLSVRKVVVSPKYRRIWDRQKILLGLFPMSLPLDTPSQLRPCYAVP